MSAVEITHDAYGIAGKSGRALLKRGLRNRGEVYLEAIDVITLIDLCVIHELDQIDALKLDTEGLDLVALIEFFAEKCETYGN